MNKWLAFPIFITIMFLVYYVSVGVIGSFTVDWITGIVETLGEKVGILFENVGASEWVNSLVVDGIIAGVGVVLGFVPQMIVLFIFLAFLETCGYMSRVAFMMDKLFRKFGLGKIMLKKAINEVKKLGGNELYLVARAPEFFRNYGFETVDASEAPLTISSGALSPLMASINIFIVNKITELRLDDIK